MQADGTSGGTRSSLVGPGLLLVLATAVISGVSTFVNLYAVHGTNSAAFVTVRNAVVALALLPVAFVALRASAGLRRVDWARLVTIGIVGGGIPFLLFFRGLELAAAAHGGITASFLYRTLFLMATVLGVVVLRERFHWRYAAAAALLLAGNMLLLSWTTPAIWTSGAGYVLAATALWAVEYTISKRALKDLKSGVVALGRMGFGALFLFGYLAATAQFGAVAALSPGQWVWVGISAALLTAFVVTWYAGLRRVDLGVAAAVLVLGFPVSWLLSVAVAGTPATLYEGIGAAAVAIGVGVAAGRSSFGAAWEYLRSLGARRRPSA